MVLAFFILYCTGSVVVIAEDSVRFAHSGPSHCHLRHRCAITCCQRAPPATRVRGWTRLSNHYYTPSSMAMGGYTIQSFYNTPSAEK